MRRWLQYSVARVLIIVLPFLLWGCTAGSPEQNESVRESGNVDGKTGVCRVQIEEYVRDKFQQMVTKIDFDFVFDQRSMGEGGGGPTSAAVVYIEECPGYHVFDVFGSDYECEASVHYGKPRNYIRYRTSEGGC